MRPGRVSVPSDFHKVAGGSAEEEGRSNLKVWGIYHREREFAREVGDPRLGDPRALEGAWKTIGNDGVFAIHGWFRSKRLGKFCAFVTNTSRTVVLDFGEQKVVISPENPDGFVNAINGRLRRA